MERESLLSAPRGFYFAITVGCYFLQVAFGYCLLFGLDRQRPITNTWLSVAPPLAAFPLTIILAASLAILADVLEANRRA